MAIHALIIIMSVITINWNDGTKLKDQKKQWKNVVATT